MIQPQADHTPPDLQDVGTHTERLKRMRDFYVEKAPTSSSTYQTMMFKDFIVTLEYSINVIERYSQLTRQLAKSESKPV